MRATSIFSISKRDRRGSVEIDYYYDEVKGTPKLKIIAVNNTVYVKAEGTAKIKYVTEDSEIRRLLNEHYKKAESGDMLKHSFDLHQFGAIIIDKARTSFIRFRDTIKDGFRKIFRKKKFIGKVFCLPIYSYRL